MADYSSVLSRAIAGKKTYEERRVVYERARNALINQLRALTPPLPEADITRQRLALEESIRKVEAEAAAANEGEVTLQPAPAPTPAPTPAPPPAAPAAAPAPPPPPNRPPPAPPAPQPAPPPPVMRERAEPPAMPPQRPAAPVPAPRPEPAFAGEAAPPSPLAETVRRAEGLGAASATAVRTARDQLDEEGPQPGLPRRPEQRLGDAGAGEPALARMRSLPATEPERIRPNRRPWIFGGIAAVLVLAVATIIFVFFVLPLGDSGDGRQRTAGRQQPEKITDRIAQDTTAPQRPPPGSTDQPVTNAQGATLAQTALLYEENADNPRGADSFRGQVTWRVDTEAGPQGPERIIRGLVEIPDRGLKVLLTIRRNSDQALPASHTVELLFDTQANFVHGAVENVAGVRMKPSEQANGVPLVGASARITAGYFLIGLTAVGPDRDRNIVLLRDRPWMDLPIVYRNGRRAVLAIEKGAPGEQAFEQAFQAWR